MKSMRLFIAAGIFGAVAFSSSAQEPAPASRPKATKQAATAPAKPPAPKTAQAETAGAPQKNDAKAAAETHPAPNGKTETNAEAKQQKSDKDVDKNGDFVPSEQIGADEQVTFPVGI